MREPAPRRPGPDRDGISGFPGLRGASDGDTAQHTTARRNTPAQRDTAQHATPRRDTTQHASFQSETTQHGTGQRGLPERSRVAPGAGPHAGDLSGLIERTVAACRAAEGQNTLGSYGTSGLTPAIRRLAAQLPAGGLAPGSESDSLKPAARVAAKLMRVIARNPGRSPEELAASMSDGVRYAFAFEPGDYTDATWLVHRKLKAQGFELEARRNRWESPEYKGIFTRWRDPAHGISFEVQFHTPASWGVAKRTHDAYLAITDPATAPAERARLRARQVAAAAAAQAPPGCAEIGDFRLEQR